MEGITIFTVGHSIHVPDDFTALLESNGIEAIADIRTVPKSGRFPHFNLESLKTSLPERRIAYRHLPRLGGWRKVDPDSVNIGWRNSSFRGYADYAMTPEFAEGLDELREMGRQRPTAMMCSEALWWRCHRRLVADRLLASGETVIHIGSDGGTSDHEMTAFAVVDGSGQITYPAES